MRSWAAAAAAALLLAIAPGGARAQAPPAIYCSPTLFEHFPLPQPFGPSLAALSCKPYALETPKQTLVLAVALNDAQRSRGLMNVRSLEQGVGMIFAFPDGDQPRSFWMKNTLIPLDMIFVEKSGRINAIFENVPSSTYDTPDDKVAQRRAVGTYVIELRAGDAKWAGLRVGIRLGMPPINAPVS